MSTDFELVCNTCKWRTHLGQRMASVFSFGYGSNDVKGAAEVAETIVGHLGHDLRIFESEDGPQYPEES